MDPAGKHVVVTGAASGIGRALAVAFHNRGARGVVVADINDVGAQHVAAGLNRVRPGSAIGIGADVGTAAGNEALIDAAQATFGAVDLFFANAGVGMGSGDLLSSTDFDWDMSLAVNVKAHIWAARRLLPEWLERGEGYFASTASAAGLLSQIGSAPYSVTKHAAVAFAEWLSITYGDAGLRVSCLCPMGVNTDMLNAGDIGDSTAGDVVRAAGVVLEPEQVAAIALDAIEGGQFLILPHAEVLTYFQRKGADYDRWLAGMRRLQARVAAS
jgi:NAD(P)-dependent dehydrogenase (short-subunit alcohol dehydrogenase family)